MLENTKVQYESSDDNEATELAQMLNQLDKPLRKTTRDMINGMLLAQEVHNTKESNIEQNRRKEWKKEE